MVCAGGTGDDQSAMTGFGAVRRAGYAPDGAPVGRRGQHTRERILACAADLFVAEGYHGTSMEVIAKSVGGSRATVYQYFESKHEIFVELAAACRPIVLRHCRSLGRLAADEAGLHELRRWLAEWVALHDKYAIAFSGLPGVGTIAQGAGADADAAPAKYTAVLAAKLIAAGITGIDPVDGAAALLRIAHTVNLRQFRAMFDLRDDCRTTGSLAVAVQRLIFPDTPGTVFATADTGTYDEAVVTAPWPAEAAAAEPDGPDATNVSPVRQDILSAASTLFTESGYYGVAMDDIAVAADVSRATLYRHFSNKVTLLGELSSWSVLETRQLSAELLEIGRGPGCGNALRAWLSRYIHFHRAYGGVTRAWYDGAIAQQLPGDSVARGIGELYRASWGFLSQFPLPPAMDRDVAAAIFLAVLGRLSEYVTVQRPNEKDYTAAGFMLTVLDRAVLGDGLDG